MDNQVSFDINEALKLYLSDPASIQTPDADSELVECENDPDSLTSQVISSALNPIVDSVAGNPDALTTSASFDTLQFLLKCAPASTLAQSSRSMEPVAKLFQLSRTSSFLPTHSLSKILDLIVSGLSAEADIAHNDIESEEQDALHHHKQLLEMYAFLLQWTISIVETKAAEKPVAAAPARKAPKGGKSKAAAKDGTWDSMGQLQTAMDVMCKVMKLKLNRIFQTTSDRDNFYQPIHEIDISHPRK